MAVTQPPSLHQNPELWCRHCGSREGLPTDAAELHRHLRLRLMQVAPGLDRAVVKSITGGFLVQSADHATLDRAAAVVKTARAPSEAMMKSCVNPGLR